MKYINYATTILNIIGTSPFLSIHLISVTNILIDKHGNITSIGK